MTLEILLVQLITVPNSAIILSPFPVKIKIGSAVAMGNILHA